MECFYIVLMMMWFIVRNIILFIFLDYIYFLKILKFLI